MRIDLIFRHTFLVGRGFSLRAIRSYDFAYPLLARKEAPSDLILSVLFRLVNAIIPRDLHLNQLRE